MPITCAWYAAGDELAQLVATWDGLAADDPRYHVPSVNVTNAGGEAAQPVAILAPHLQAAMAKHVTDDTKSQRVDVMVAQLTASTGAIYSADFLLEQLLTSVRGKYMEFRQFPKGGDFTPLQTLLARRGFFTEQSRDLRGDRGALLLRSDVTGKQRVVMTFPGLATPRPLAVTFDPVDGRTRPSEQFLRNLIAFEPFSDASELLIPMLNGLIEFGLADGRGALQRFAPPDVVADTTKPAGHTQQLEAGMSCILCHAPQRGYRTARNDMALLLGSDTDFFGHAQTYKRRDGTVVELEPNEAVAIVTGRFGERIDEPENVLGRARRDYVAAVDALTDYKPSGDGKSSVEFLGESIKAIYHGYRYQSIERATGLPGTRRSRLGRRRAGDVAAARSAAAGQ
ncbi:MAG: hypothetical protein QM775_16745 [Pirellulales bacterium]